MNEAYLEVFIWLILASLTNWWIGSIVKTSVREVLEEEGIIVGEEQ